jgi:hypothetical protein
MLGGRDPTRSRRFDPCTLRQFFDVAGSPHPHQDIRPSSSGQGCPAFNREGAGSNPAGRTTPGIAQRQSAALIRPVMRWFESTFRDQYFETRADVVQRQDAPSWPGKCEVRSLPSVPVSVLCASYPLRPSCLRTVRLFGLPDDKLGRASSTPPAPAYTGSPAFAGDDDRWVGDDTGLMAKNHPP